MSQTALHKLAYMRRYASGEDVPVSPWRMIRLDTPGERHRVLGSCPNVMFVMQGEVAVINGMYRGATIRKGEMAVVPANRTCTVSSTALSYVMACRFDPKKAGPGVDIRGFIRQIMESADDTGIVAYDRRIGGLISQVHDTICNGILDPRIYNDACNELIFMLYTQMDREKANRIALHLMAK